MAKIKMTVLYKGKAGNASEMAEAVGRSQQAKIDQIPPAYNMENQKLVVVCVEGGKKADSDVMKFISNLNPSRVKNMAIICIGAEFGCVDEMKASAEKLGVVVGNVKQVEVKGGLFKKGKLEDAQKTECVDWTAKIVDSLVG